jgi:predicted SprT family Zn-dependent metalloprotease
MEIDRTIQIDDDLDFPTPTAATYGTFNEAFDALNHELFGGELPDVLITMQRHKGSRGYFAAQRFAHRRADDVVDEIALNPAAMQDRTDRQVASTLAHEMVHLWQEHHGKPGRRGYHNKQWAAKMEAIGLMPSHTGEPGGKRTGQAVTHFIIDGGPFDRAWTQLEQDGFRFDYQDRLTNGPETVRKIKVRYACSCAHVWGKPGLSLQCLACDEAMR